LWDELDRRVALGRQLPDSEQTWDAAGFSRLLSIISNGTGLAYTSKGPGRVRLLPAEVARSQQAPFVFVMGLGERGFPRRAGPEPFFAEQERQAFRPQGLDFTCADDIMLDEMLLFYQVVAAASRRLFLSYPAVDDKGQDLLPSPFLSAVIDCFQPGAVPMLRRRMLIEGYDSDVPLSPAEFRVQLASRRAAATVRNLPPPLGDNVEAARRMAHHRFAERSYGIYDGLLRDPRALEALGHAVGPDKVFSPTALEDYVACPFRYFMGHVLHLEPLEEPSEKVEDTRRGQVFHRALARLHRDLNAIGTYRPNESTVQVLQTHLDRAVDEYAAAAGPAGRVLWHLEAEWLKRAAGRYALHWSRFQAPWHELQMNPGPHFLEKSFGLPPEAGEEPSPPLLLDIDGVQVRLGGRIDRVDLARLADGIGFWVIDYKTGRAQYHGAKELESLERLQLLLYALAVERVLLPTESARPLGLAYWMVAESGPKTVLPSTKQHTAWLSQPACWATVRLQLERWVATLVRHIRSGIFPLKPRSENCTDTCDFAQVCRISQSRWVDKDWELALPQLSTDKPR
jgi:ATP-dependent helicase/DNAse subunit B